MILLHKFNDLIRNLAATILITSIITTPLAHAKPTAIVPSTHQVQSNQGQSSHHIQAERFIAKTNVVDLENFDKKKRKVKKKKWYGFQILLAELLDFIYFVPYFISAPVIHLLNDQPSNALYSLGVRVAFPLVGALAGVGIYRQTYQSSADDRSYGEDWSFIIYPLMLGFLGAVAAIVYDISIIAYKDVFVSKQAFIRPTIGEPSTNVFGLGQAPMFKLNFSF